MAHGPVKIPFSLRYEDIKVGAGPIAEPHKVYRVRYTGLAGGRRLQVRFVR